MVLNYIKPHLWLLLQSNNRKLIFPSETFETATTLGSKQNHLFPIPTKYSLDYCRKVKLSHPSVPEKFRICSQCRDITLPCLTAFNSQPWDLSWRIPLVRNKPFFSFPLIIYSHTYNVFININSDFFKMKVFDMHK